MDDSTRNHVEENNYYSNVSYEEISTTKQQQQTNSQETIESPNSESLNGIVKQPPYGDEYEFMKVEQRMYQPPIIEETANNNYSKPDCVIPLENKTEASIIIEKQPTKEQQVTKKDCDESSYNFYSCIYVIISITRMFMIV